jgi:excisionase family DNA binding protein
MQTFQPKAKMATVKSAAEIFSVSQYFVRQLALTKKINAIRIGNSKLLVDLESIDAYLLAGNIECEEEAEYA